MVIPNDHDIRLILRGTLHLFCLAVLGLAGCSQRSAEFGGSGGVLRMAVPQDPKTLNPILTSSTIDASVQRLMFEPLISADAQGRQVPMLASQIPSEANGGISRDGLTITYHLRRNVRWTDGVPFSSKDVAFSFAAVMNRNNNVVSHHGYDDVLRVDTPDPHTAVVHLRKPFAPFIDTFFAESDSPYDVLPAHALSRYPSLNQIPFNNGPAVTDGPFKFVRWAHGDRIVLTANDAFFLGKPKLGGIEVLTVANENSAVNLLRTGAIDYMYQASITTYPQLHAVPGVRLVWLSMNGYEGMAFNLRRKPMNDARFRQAVAYAIDKDELVRTLTYGREKVANADLPDWLWAANHDLRPARHDLATARAFMRAAGIRTPLRLTIVTDTANVTHRREAVMLQSMLRDIGIDVEIKLYPGDLLYAPAGMGGIINGTKFDLALWPWYAGLDPDNSSQFTCANVPPNGYNSAGYCNAQMDALQNQALSHYGKPSRKAAYRRIEAMIARDNPILFFWWQRQQEALRDNVRGFAPNSVQETWNAWEWSKTQTGQQM